MMMMKTKMTVKKTVTSNCILIRHMHQCRKIKSYTNQIKIIALDSYYVFGYL